MSQQLVVFISSTVQDLEGVRRALKDRFEARGVQVRVSEDPDFPVEPGVSSHDACLRAVRTSHVFVLLVGSRFGGEYQGQNKSITWREWEEAMTAGVLPIVLVAKPTNDLALAIFKRRRALQSEFPAETVQQIDRRLRAEPAFSDQKPDRHHLPGVQRFIDALRKGHVDNWMHADWDGTPDGAIERIDARLSTAFALAERQKRHLRGVVEAERLRSDALHQVLSAAGTLAVAVQRGELPREKALFHLLQLIVAQRGPLLGYRDGDRFNFVVYRREGELLVPFARCAHHTIPTHGRSWRVGQGHVGLAVAEGQLLVSGDIRHTQAWVPSEARPTDREHYVSAVSVPFSYRTATDDPEGVFIVTSSRLDHFQNPHQVEVLTIGSLVNTLVMILA
ncbi:MAG: DUF4062 domain-containing protein [Sandaracinaceae bacterium]